MAWGSEVTPPGPPFKRQQQDLLTLPAFLEWVTSEVLLLSPLSFRVLWRVHLGARDTPLPAGPCSPSGEATLCEPHGVPAPHPKHQSRNSEQRARPEPLSALQVPSPPQLSWCRVPSVAAGRPAKTLGKAKRGPPQGRRSLEPRREGVGGSPAPKPRVVCGPGSGSGGGYLRSWNLEPKGLCDDPPSPLQDSALLGRE